MIEATLDKSEKIRGFMIFSRMAAPFGITDMERIKKLQKQAGELITISI